MEATTQSNRHSQQVSHTLSRARQAAGLSLRDLARRAGTSHATLLAYEKGRKAPSVETFLRVLEAANFAVDFELSPRIRVMDGLDRGEELEQALDLAARFPARHNKHLALPRFGAGGRR
ncbi:MAG: helix-turn-helix transcriptional regulator [Pirellulales bacterium]